MRKAPNLGKPFATARELVRFRQNVAKANKRIERLEKEGLEPKILSFLKSAIDGDKIRIPRGKAFTQQAYLKIKALTERFLGAATSKVKAAREGEQKHREQFHESIIKAFGEEIDKALEQRLYYAMGDIDIKKLRDEYTYEELLFAAEQLTNVNLKITTDLVDSVLQNNIGYVVADELEVRGIPTDGSTIRDYVDIGIQYGIDEAIKQYQLDQMGEGD